MRSRTGVWVVVGVVLATPIPASSHDIVDPELVRRLMSEIALASWDSQQESDPKGEALYHLGEKVEQLVELMNQEISSHGGSDQLTQSVVKRLESYQINVRLSERENRLDYDLAAFREYLIRAPKGKWASAAQFRLIARTFYQTVAPDPSRLANTDVPGVLKAIAEEERFLKDYQGDVKAKEVLFFLAVDYYRVCKNMQGEDRLFQYERLARRALADVKARYPGSMEGRAAEVLLDSFNRN